MMSEAPPQAASSEEIEQALSYLRLLWGDKFLIGHDEQGTGRRGTVMSGGASCARTTQASWASW
jgi:hypothetical protein